METEEVIVSRKRTIIADSVILILLFYAVFRYRGFLKEVCGLIGGTGIAVPVVTAGISAVYFAMECCACYLMCRSHSSSFRYSDGIQITFITAFFRFLTLGSGGMPAKVYCCHRKGLEISDATGVWLMQYFFAKLATVLAGLLALALFPEFAVSLPVGIPAVILGICVAVLIVLLLAMAALNRRITERCHKRFERMHVGNGKIREKTEKIFEQINLLQTESRRVMGERKLSVGMLILSMAMTAVYCMIPSAMLYHAGGIPITYGTGVMAFTNMLAGAIPAPSGYGSVELVFYSLLTPCDVNVEAAGTLVMFRFFTVILPFFVGTVLWFFSKRTGKRNK